MMQIDSSEARSMLDQGYKRLLATFAAVPDDKLGFKPSPTSKSPIEIIAHCGSTNLRLAGALARETAGSAGAAAAPEASSASPGSRKEALELLAESVSKLDSAIEKVTPDMLSRTVALPFGQMPMARLIAIPSSHLQGHAAQIDYIQTIWGDMDGHWG